MFTWGGGGSSYNKGQCGHGHLSDIDVPMEVHDLSGEGVMKIAAGGYHTIAVTAESHIYTWGSNQFGECGTGHQ